MAAVEHYRYHHACSLDACFAMTNLRVDGDSFLPIHVAPSKPIPSSQRNDGPSPRA